MNEPQMLIIPAFIALVVAYWWCKPIHYRNGRWLFGMARDGWQRLALKKRRTHTDPDFIDFGKKDGKHIVRWGRFQGEVDDYGDRKEESIEVEVRWFLMYPDLETLRRLVFYPWVEEEIAKREFDLTPPYRPPWGYYFLLYDSSPGLTSGEAFDQAFPEWIEEAREKLEHIKALQAAHRMPRGWSRY